MSFTALTVSVPVGKEAELLQFAASLALPEEEPSARETSVIDVVNSVPPRRWGWDREAVIESYSGGISDVWRPFLDYMAERPGEWVAWPDLYKHVEMTAQEASGMLGAAERRCSGRLPYEKVWKRRVRYFRMPAEVAEVIVSLKE